MIGPNAYNASFYTMAEPPLAGRKAAVADAAAAADFARILNQAAPVNSTAAPEGGDGSFLGFVKTVIDAVNPLQHIPLVGALYRHMTGDEINPAARLAGDALYGGPIGAALAAVDIAWQKTTGRDMGETMIAALTKDKGKNPADPAAAVAMVARNLNDQVLPAAGDAQTAGIIWSTPADTYLSATNSRLSSTLPLLRSVGTNEEEPAPQPTPTHAPPVHQAKDTVVPLRSPPAASKADPTTVLQPQEAPAAASRMDVPPALIAVKMMEALDKYQQMKSAGLAPVVSGMY